MVEYKYTKEEKRRKFAINVATLISLCGLNYIGIPGLIDTVKGMVQSGITLTGLTNMTILSMLTVIPDFFTVLSGGIQIYHGVKKMKNRNKEKNNANSRDENSQKMDKDPRFQGQEHPPKVERQAQEQSRDRSQNDSREP